MKKKKRYNPIRNYKKFKSEYLYFILFIKNGDNYITFDTDAKILMDIYDSFNSDQIYSICKENFKEILKDLHWKGLNVALAGWKNVDEYYSEKENKYIELKKKAVANFKDHFYSRD